MKYDTVAELTVTDPGWTRDYVAAVTPMVERYGGRYLARSTAFEKLEGDREPPQLILLIEWPDEEAALEFHESDDYRPYRERRAGSHGEFLLVAGEDVNRVARSASSSAADRRVGHAADRQSATRPAGGSRRVGGTAAGE